MNGRDTFDPTFRTKPSSGLPSREGTGDHALQAGISDSGTV